MSIFYDYSIDLFSRKYILLKIYNLNETYVKQSTHYRDNPVFFCLWDFRGKQA